MKVLDFGLARLTVGHGHTTVDSIRGTPAFMPPEVVRGEPAGPESDVYAMGACLYYMLTGTPVFRARGFHEQVSAQLEGKVEPPSKRLGNDDIPPDVEAIVLKCLSKNRADRYVTAKELEQALASCRMADAWSKQQARMAWEEIRPSLGTMVTRPG
jgi:eukaryotic-like serine/threonine-protein kinase